MVEVRGESTGGESIDGREVSSLAILRSQDHDCSG
jgi:hypothetical protein